MVVDLLIRGFNEWNVFKVKFLFLFILKEIFCIFLSILGVIDDFVWIFTKDGVYIIKLGYFIVMKSRVILNNEVDLLFELEWMKKVWGIFCFLKVKFFM